MSVDKKRLLAHLKAKAAQYAGHLLIASMPDGLRTAVERGDFDEEEVND